ncbi:MAG: hypothetical protein AB1531_11280 [Chloroflexota bacterium]
MNKISLMLLAGLLLAGLLAGCRPDETPGLEEAPGAVSQKGFELYTWQEDGQWYFALLEGTNRLKTDEEILSAGRFMDGPEELQEALKRLAPGQFVSWMALERFPLPDEATIGQVEQACRDLGLKCVVVR